VTEKAARRRLGRGLEALLGPSAPTTAEARAAGALVQVPLHLVRPNPYQPRRAFDDDALGELAASLERSGLLQPIVVRSAPGGYELIVGERRLRAAERLGWREIGAIIREVDDRTLLTLALVENLQRDALSPIDEALGYQRLISEFAVSHGDVADLVGRNRSTVANALRLLKLPDEVQDLVHRGTISTGHARALLQLKEPAQMAPLARRAAEEGLSVREVEALARGGRIPASRPRAARSRLRKPDSEVRRVEDALRRALKTDVFMVRRGKGGRITVNFYSNDDLARLLELILGRPFDG
jgi:ParB family chromosome partitioning protein